MEYRLVEYRPADQSGVKPALVSMARKRIHVIYCTDKGVTLRTVPLSESVYMRDTISTQPIKAINRWLLHSAKTLGITKPARKALMAEKARIKNQ